MNPGISRLFSVCLLVAALVAPLTAMAADSLAEGFAQPPVEARVRAYWWWLNGNVTAAAITRDLEAMRAQGFGGAIVTDAGGAEQDGNDRVPHGPTFMSPEWRELWKHTVREASRLGLEISLNMQSGWNLGGPGVPASDAAKQLVYSEVRVAGSTNLSLTLPMPKRRDNYYQDQFTVAYRVKPIPAGRKPLQNIDEKALYKPLRPFSAPSSAPLFEEHTATPGEEDTRAPEVVDLSARLGPDGTLRWEVPPGEWQILRFGCTIGDHSYVSTCSDGWQGYAVDVLNADAFERYWIAVLEPLIADAGPHAGKAFKYLHTDSWEVEPLNWTPALFYEFRQRRGYDPVPFAPVLAGRIVNSREESNRFLHDFRKTVGDLAIDHHYRLFRDLAHKHGLLIHPESGGPHSVPIDAQRCLGWNDVPMSEFWAWSWRHRVGDANRFFIKQPASAAHTYGHNLVFAEGFTTIGPHWQERLCDNLKPSFDHALCEGLNVLVWHAFVCSPEAMGVPGQQYFAGTHLNPNVTWWSRSAPFFAYLNRCQWLLQQGHFVADALYYYGDHVPNFTQMKASDPAHVLPGFDYDVLTEEALLERVSVANGRFVLTDGMSYAVLALPNRAAISLPALRKIESLVQAGGTILGPKPVRAETLQNYPECDAEVAHLADGMWGVIGTGVGERAVGQGRVVWGKTARQTLLDSGLAPDFEVVTSEPGADIEYVHRRTADTEIYFVASRSNRWETARCAFRVADKAPELWNPVTGERRFATAYEKGSGRVTVPLEFAPCGSWFVIFREPTAQHPSVASANSATLVSRAELAGAWTVRFDPHWGGPETAAFDKLESWTARSEPGIRFYSGTATYAKTFDLPAGLDAASNAPLWLDLGEVRELAEVRLNGQSLGVVWAPPFRVDISKVVKASGNRLEIDVVNFWPNRIIGDQSLPPEKRLTRTNIKKFTADTPLMESGLIGPVTLRTEKP